MSYQPTHIKSLDLLCPMHAQLCPQGRIRHAGPTLRKLRPEQTLIDTAFFDVFDVVRPQGIHTIQALWQHAGRKLHLKFRDGPDTGLKAVTALDPCSDALLINLSFGISILDAVSDYALTSADFAPTDLTVEMLYLVEAKSAAMDASRRLNERLQGAKLVAEEQALTDALTGLTNRRGLEAFVDKLITRKAAFAVMHIDLDFFKQVNDTHGHAAGDCVLEQAAQIMGQETRDRDLISRVGGDEFVMIIDAPKSRKGVEAIATRLITEIEKPISFQDIECSISCSIGIVFSDDIDAPDTETLFHHADMALYASKDAGRGRHTVFSP